MTIEKRRYDALIIGSGQAGNPLAAAFASAGRRTAIVERKKVGGSCINYGCTPTKTMVASARAAHLARRAADYGVLAGEISVDLAAVIGRKDQIVDRFRASSQEAHEKTEGIDLLFGHARFTGQRIVEVALRDGDTLVLEAETIFINTGTRPSTPRIDGLDKVPFLDNRSVMELDSLPRRLIVLGGGYVGLEFAQMYRRFGSEVTIIQRRPQLLACEDEDIADAVATILREDGIEVLLEAEASRVSRTDEGVRVHIDVGGNRRTLEGSHLLVATGRTPNTDDLGLEAAGVETDERGYVRADERLRTTASGVFALGDIKGGPAFTHISYDDYRIASANLLHGADRTTSGRLVPYTVFIDPQLGRVGLGEREAREQGLDVRVATLPMSHVVRAIESGETRGLMKAVVDRASDRILGGAVLGLEGGETAALLQVAMMANLPYQALRDGVFAHPTLAESLNSLFMAIDR